MPHNTARYHLMASRAAQWQYIDVYLPRETITLLFIGAAAALATAIFGDVTSQSLQWRLYQRLVCCLSRLDVLFWLASVTHFYDKSFSPASVAELHKLGCLFDSRFRHTFIHASKQASNRASTRERTPTVSRCCSGDTSINISR